MRPVELRELLLITIAVRPIVELGGGRRYVSFDGGTFEGPDGLAGAVLEGGVDWQPIVRANRGFGPELPMKLVEERAPDGFADVTDIITAEEIAEVTENYRATAGFSVAALQGGASLMEDPYRL